MPTLEWIGKNKVINHDKDVPFKLLDAKYSFDENGQHDAKEEDGNMIIHGDNLVVLKSLLPKYGGRVDCIYIDPPYNTGNEKWVYNDNVNDPQIKKWINEVVGKEGEDLSRHDKWLCMMYPRLKLLHELLSDKGVIFISIDDNEVHNLKHICNEIFGESNFVTSFIWQKKTGASDAKTIATITEYIVVYTKNHDMQNNTFKKNEKSYDLTRYKYKDEFYNERGAYYIDNLDRGGLQYSDSLNYGIECPDGTITFPNGRKYYKNDGWIWKWSKQKIEWALENKFLEFRKSTKKDSGWSVCYKNYLKVDNENKRIERAAPFKNLITDILNADASANIKEIFNQMAFPYSKPPELVKFLISIINKDNPIILDSFAGSGTTAHAVMNLNKEDGGNRKFILVEMMDYAENITAERVKRVIKGYGEGDKAVAGTGGGFAFYELGLPLFDEDSNLNGEIATEKIREYIWYTETQTALVPVTSTNEDFLGVYKNTGYYFIYKKDAATTFDKKYLRKLKKDIQGYVVYADSCTVSEKDLESRHIKFKKIPRDITRI